MKKGIYAYSDDDGYIHYNVQEGTAKSSIWNHQTGSWLKREPDYDIGEALPPDLWIFLIAVNLITLIMAFVK